MYRLRSGRRRQMEVGVWSRILLPTTHQCGGSVGPTLITGLSSPPAAWTTGPLFGAWWVLKSLNWGIQGHYLAHSGYLNWGRRATIWHGGYLNWGTQGHYLVHDGYLNWGTQGWYLVHGGYLTCGTQGHFLAHYGYLNWGTQGQYLAHGGYLTCRIQGH